MGIDAALELPPADAEVELVRVNLIAPLASGLLDEIVVQVVPVLLGDGVRLLDAPGGERVRLEKSGVAESGQLADLRFRVAR